jgi:hypothetical protein
MIDPSNYKIYFFNGTDQYGEFIELDGINNLSFSKNLSFADQYVLGGSKAPKSINAPQEIQLSFDRSFVQEDFFLNYTGKNPILKFFVFDGNQYYEMSNMYLRSYSAAFSVGDLPKISTAFSSYGSEIKQVNGLNFNGDYSYISTQKVVDIPNLDSITINGNFNSDFKSKFKIYSFDYSIDINRQVYYSIGSSEPIEVSPVLPLRITSSINSKIPAGVSNLTQPNFLALNENYIDFSIHVTRPSYTFSFPVTKADLVSIEYQLSSQNTIEVKRNFVGYYGLL